MSLKLKQEILQHIRAHQGAALFARDLQRRFRVNGRARRPFLRLLEELVEEGSLVQLRGERYALPRPADLANGKITLHRDGYAFVVPESGQGGDYFIAGRNLGGAMDGDQVQVAVVSGRRGDHREGRVVKILEHAVQELVGIYHAGRGHGLLIPFQKKAGPPFEVLHTTVTGAKDGEVVIGRIERYPLPGQAGQVKIVRVLGAADDPAVELLTVAHRFELPYEFSPAALAQASSIAQTVAIDELDGRRDLRDSPFVTIDGETARDFDDAVALVKEAGGYRLWVAIADVAWYVTPGSALDVDALARGTSVYFPGTCLPMLPERLSNGICSLNPGVDRLVLVAELTFNKSGQRQQSTFYPAVINSRARLTYTQVQAFFDQEIANLGDDVRLGPQLLAMAELTRILQRMRQQRGSLDFELPEAEIVLDDNGRPIQIQKMQRLFAHRLVEEFMLAANEAVATYLEANRSPLLYRVHEPPTPEKLQAFQQFVAHFNHGIQLSGERVRPQELQRLLTEIVGTPEEKVINQVLLRSMKQASYAVTNHGHFGLAADDYCHFTSPIRRYPDLVIHRAIRACLKNKPLSVSVVSQELAADVSTKERRAMAAERDFVALKKCQFMASHIGGSFEATVASVQPFGLFVELDGIFIEGLVHISALQDDHYNFEEDLQRLVGYNRHRIFQVGVPIKVRLVRVSLDSREIDFVPDEPERRSQSLRRGRGQR